MENKVYNLDNTAIDIYFQKSIKFLYPLLKIDSTHTIKPIQSYVAWQGKIDICECKLICVYELINTLEYRQFEKDTLLKNEFFESYVGGVDNKGIYVFNLNSYQKDYTHFLKGKYSLLSTDSKDLLKKFYSLNQISTAYIDSFLYPENYYEKYARLLNVDEWRLRSVGELVDPFNREKETLIMEKAGNNAIAA